MKVGILVECGREGPEVIFCRRIAELLRQELTADFVLELDIVPMDNKLRLLEECGAAARGLLEGGCDRVVILWDERPAWPMKEERLCWHNDREKILGELRQAGLDESPVYLVCIERELESWLLFDERVISCVLSTPAHPVRVPPQRHPDQIPNPKSKMISLFRQFRGWRYVDLEHAPKFAVCLTDLARLRKCRTFRRFEAKLLPR
jgi:hypothetical protein